VRRNEVARPAVRAALEALAARHEGTRDGHIEELLGLPHDEARVLPRYVPVAA
jgi:hypothetical protein